MRTSQKHKKNNKTQANLTGIDLAPTRKKIVFAPAPQPNANGLMPNGMPHKEWLIKTGQVCAAPHCNTKFDDINHSAPDNIKSTPIGDGRYICWKCADTPINDGTMYKNDFIKRRKMQY